MAACKSKKAMDVDEKESPKKEIPAWMTEQLEMHKLRRDPDKPKTADELKKFIGRQILITDEDRVPCKDRGTVRYIGPVATAKNKDQLWVGVEWDRPGRGKHDGSVTTKDGETTSYFKCEDGKGSFLKPKVVQFPTDLLSSLLWIYNLEEFDIISQDQRAIEKSATYKMEFVGWDKYKTREYNLKARKSLALDWENVGWVDRIYELKTLCPLIRSVNMSNSLIHSWTSVANLGAAFPKLEKLSLDCVKLSDFDLDDFKSQLENVDELTIANSNCFGPVVDLLQAGALPSLKLLEAGHANFLEWFKKAKPSPVALAKSMARIKKLRIVAVGASWDELRVFRRLPALESFDVAGNPIKKLRFEKGDFPVVTNLNIGETQLDGGLQGAILLGRELSKLPKLESLGHSRTPLTGNPDANDILRYELPQVKVNSAAYEPEKKQREANMNCVVMYHKFAAKETARQFPDLLEDLGKLRAKVLDLYPRCEKDYLERINEYVALAKKKGAAGKVDTVQVKLRTMDEKSCTLPSKDKKLPVSMKIKTLKALFKRYYKLPIEEQRLSFQRAGMDMPIPMANDDKTLEQYGVSDGCQLLMYNATL